MTFDLFAATIQQFMRGPVPNADLEDAHGADAKSATAEATAASTAGWHGRLVEHWVHLLSHERDLPLPLGSAVPAAPGIEGHLLPLTATPVQRAVLALLALQYLPQLEVVKTQDNGMRRVRADAGRHARQCAGSRDDFLLRHPPPPELRLRPSHLNRQYVQALCQLAQDALHTAGWGTPLAVTAGQPVDHAYLDNLVQRMNDLRNNDIDRLAGDPRFVRPRYLTAYGPDDLTATDDEADWHHTSYAEAEAVRRQLALPFGEWRLLTLLYYKLVSGLLCHSRLLFAKTGAALAQQAVVRRIVHAAAFPGDDEADRPLAPYAAGIDRVLGEAMVPAGPAWQLGLLPACFVPGRIDGHAATLAQARRLLGQDGQDGLGGLPEWADWVDRVGQLAQETASLITDPHLASSLGMRAQDFLFLKTHMEAKLHKREEGRLQRAAPDDDFRFYVLRPRMARLQGFNGWMADEGLAASQAAWLDAATIFKALAEADPDNEPLPCRHLPSAGWLTTTPAVPGLAPQLPVANTPVAR